jgi:hypothetical protein
MAKSRSRSQPIEALAQSLEQAVMTPPKPLDFILSLVEDVFPHLSTDEVERLHIAARKLDVACGLLLEERRHLLH